MTELVRYEQEAAIHDEYQRLNLLICKLLIERLHDTTSDAKLLFMAGMETVLRDLSREQFNT